MKSDRHTRRVAVIVAHPDDETLWCGGYMLMHPEWRWTVVSLCRGKDPDRAPRFYRALRQFGAFGNMGDLDDGPEQTPLPGPAVEQAVLNTLPRVSYDLIITHSREGEYTRHGRHEEVGKAMRTLWKMGRLQTEALWTFAYSDGGRCHLPTALDEADFVCELPEAVWKSKHQIITGIYGFAQDSFEARTTPRIEAFDYRDRRSLVGERHGGAKERRRWRRS